MEAFLSNTSLLLNAPRKKKWSPWSRTWSISWHLHPRIGKTCSHNRAVEHREISCLPRESSLNRWWPWWILPQAIKDIYIKNSPGLSCPWFLADLERHGCTELLLEIEQSFHVHFTWCHYKHPGYKKRNRLRMSPILHPTNFVFFSLGLARN